MYGRQSLARQIDQAPLTASLELTSADAASLDAASLDAASRHATSASASADGRLPGDFFPHRQFVNLIFHQIFGSKIGVNPPPRRVFLYQLIDVRENSALVCRSERGGGREME